jgi:hypothetical protein
MCGDEAIQLDRHGALRLAMTRQGVIPLCS